jgi:hypothetical protein
MVTDNLRIAPKELLAVFKNAIAAEKDCYQADTEKNA